MIDTHRPVDPTTDRLAHLVFTEIARELRQAPAYETSGKSSRSLARSADLSMVLMALREGAELKEHHAPGPATAIVLEGEIEFSSASADGAELDTQTVLGAHQCAVFSPLLQHAVRASKETLLLVVIGGKTSTA
jgi:hypothetical protein